MNARLAVPHGHGIGKSDFVFTIWYFLDYMLSSDN